MTEPLFRKDAMTPRSRSLSGAVILHAHIPTLIITALVLATAVLAGSVLWFGQVQTENGPARLLYWLLGRES